MCELVAGSRKQPSQLQARVDETMKRRGRRRGRFLFWREAWGNASVYASVEAFGRGGKVISD